MTPQVTTITDAPSRTRVAVRRATHRLGSVAERWQRMDDRLNTASEPLVIPVLVLLMALGTPLTLLTALREWASYVPQPDSLMSDRDSGQDHELGAN